MHNCYSAKRFGVYDWKGDLDQSDPWFHYFFPKVRYWASSSPQHVGMQNHFCGVTVVIPQNDLVTVVRD